MNSVSRISVIMPVYNVRPFLREAIDSVLRQTFREWELILIDDGSTDGCSALCDAYAERDGRIRVFHTANNGVDAARNLGLEKARSEWIAFADSDDLLAEHALETLYGYTAGVSAVIGGYREQPSNRRYQAFEQTASIGKLNESEDVYIRIDRSFVLSCLHAKLYRKNAIKHPFRTDRRYADDTFFNMDNLFEMDSIVFVPGFLYTYRRREDTSALHNGAQEERLQASFDLMKLALERFPGSARVRDYLNGKMIIRIYNDLIRKLNRAGSDDEEDRIIRKILQDPVVQEMTAVNASVPLPQLNTFWNGICTGDPVRVRDALEETGKAHIRSDSPGLISVIVPVYNMENTLGDAVGSILAQTYPHWELFLVDDGSTDNTGAVADQYSEKDARIHVFHQTNGGIGAGRNTAMPYASGEWVAFLDADDIYLPESFAQMIEQSDGADLVACGTYIHHVPMYCSPYNEVKVFDGLPDGEDLDKLWANCVYPVVWAKLYRRSMIHETFAEDLNYGEDTLFNFRVFAQLGKIVVIPQIGYHYIRRRERLDRGMLEGARRQLVEAAELFRESDVILRRIYIAFVRQVRRFALNVIDSEMVTAEEKAEELAFCGRLAQLPQELDHEEFLFPVNLAWWRQLKAGQYETAVEGLRVILEERRRKRNVLYQDRGSDHQS